MLQIEDASIAYGNDVLFSNFNLQLERGEIASISGSSGCGKTSLLNAILGFTPLKEGRITVNDIVSDKKQHRPYSQTNSLDSTRIGTTVRMGKRHDTTAFQPESQSSHTVLRKAIIQLL